MRLGGGYLRILLAFNVPMAVGIVLASGLRGAGDVRTPLAIGALMNAVNLLGHWLLVFGNAGAPRLETAGSALATGFSFTAGALVYLVLWRRNELAIERSGWLAGLSLEPLRRILRIGLPTAAEQFAFQIGLFLFLRIVAGFGTEPVAAYLIGVRILSFSFVPGLGFSTAASTLVGQHLGAGERASRDALGLARDALRGRGDGGRRPRRSSASRRSSPAGSARRAATRCASRCCSSTCSAPRSR